MQGGTLRHNIALDKVFFSNKKKMEKKVLHVTNFLIESIFRVLIGSVLLKPFQ